MTNQTGEKTIQVKWVKSAIGGLASHKKTLKALGFTRLNQTLTKQASPQVLGMVRAVQHLVAVEEAK